MRTIPGFVRLLCLSALLASASASVLAQDALPADLSAKIDKVANDALAKSGVPSASVAVVRDGKIVYAKAYGDARLDPKTPATSAMRYSVGSISKEFTAGAILLLQQEGKLSLDDKVAKFFPDLTDADHITIRQILSHTAGYQDYWPQDYLMPMMRQPTTTAQIMDGWAKKPLDFAPGAQWQYSNTGYVVAGAIVQKVSGQTPFEFLQQHVFPALGVTDAYDTDQHALPAGDARGYSRNALGPLRPSMKEGVNWMFAAGELAMTASDLAKWDVAMIDQKVLSPASWQAMQTEVVLNNGLGSGYGLGVFVGRMDNRRMIFHDGEVMGFTAGNYIFPDDRTAVVVLTNQDAVGAFGVIGNGIAKAVFEVHDAASTKALAQAETIFAGLQHGKIDRGLFSPNGNSYFDATALKDYQSSLAPLGKPTAFTLRATRMRGGMQMRAYTVEFSKTKLSVSTYMLPDGKLEQYIVASTD
ncbi:serine hydrolase domain-containing protein [Rhodanobacter sp. DHG33]|uniref:serine hydrolase domain-containing protein n=1 Tax=Rhodanobacter sp. DHG33 TaxID=2775921 RepID=UPI001782B2D5|nr:serine hydrolase domain-containing protein [Rhodanobacter sp. DHG33]MBD8898626.1 beta-lactamase family protein [Rhodanobacter sp. DHG33]